MASDHPFQLLFETLGRIPTANAESVNRQAYEILLDILSVPMEKTGRCILLRAPRAGHGKTHLLSRIQHQLGASYEFIPLQAAFGCRIDAATVTDDTLRRLVRQLPASGGLTVLDLVTRRLFASALQPLVSSGEVPCQDREGALTALRVRPIEAFDFHHPNAVTAHWARENFEVLGQRLSYELALRSGLPVREIAFWVDHFFRFASAPPENSNRVRLLAECVHGAPGTEMERLEALLGLLSLLMRVVLVADDLEGFSTDETAALRLAAFLSSLRQSVERVDVILSLNQDIWQSAFVPRLSGGLADRLSEVVIELEPLTEAEMVALLDSRVPGFGNQVLKRIDVRSAGTHARGLIRAAGMAWLKAADSPPTVVAVPSVFVHPSSAEEPQDLTEVALAEPEMKFETLTSESALPLAAEPEPASIQHEPVFLPSPPVKISPELTARQPLVTSSFQMGPPVEVADSGIEPELEVHISPKPPSAPTPQNSPFSLAVEPPAADWQRENPPAVVNSSFWILPESDTPEPTLLELEETPLEETPFQITESQSDTSEFKAAPDTTVTAVEEPTPSIVDTHRVDDLLRQFRERYGRGSL